VDLGHWAVEKRWRRGRRSLEVSASGWSFQAANASDKADLRERDHDSPAAGALNRDQRNDRRPGCLGTSATAQRGKIAFARSPPVDSMNAARRRLPPTNAHGQRGVSASGRIFFGDDEGRGLSPDDRSREMRSRAARRPGDRLAWRWGCTGLNRSPSNDGGEPLTRTLVWAIIAGMDSTDAKSRRRAFERTIELELEPLELRDTIGLTLIFASLCVVSCGSVLFFGSAWSHLHGNSGYIGIALLLGGGMSFGLTLWLLEPRKAARHASHRLRHHARKLRRTRREPARPMTNAEFDALEDAVDQSSAKSPT
jgi:hypothetical protein